MIKSKYALKQMTRLPVILSLNHTIYEASVLELKKILGRVPIMIMVRTRPH